MPMIDRIRDYDLDDVVSLTFRGEAKHDVSLRSDFSDRDVIIKNSSVLTNLWNLLGCPTFKVQQEDLAYEAQTFAETYHEETTKLVGRYVDSWTDPADLDEDEEPEWNSYDDYLAACLTVIKAYPDDLLYGWLDAETVRHDAKNGTVVGSFALSTTWGDCKDDAALWALVDSAGLTVEIDVGGASVVLTKA